MRRLAIQQILAAPPEPSGGAGLIKRWRRDSGDDDIRGLRPLLGDLLDEGRREAACSTGRRARTSSATPPRTTASGCIFDWDEAGWQSFVSDPEVPPIMKEAGHTSRAQVAELIERLDA